jgi:excinuclease ABC subunit A
LGHVLGVDPDLVIPDKKLSIFEGAISPWKGEKMGLWLVPLVKNGIHFDFPIHRPYSDLSIEEQELLWTGNSYFEGLNHFFNYLEENSYKIQYRVMLSRYRGRSICPDCRGTRIRKDASYVKIQNKSIQDIVLLPINEAIDFFDNLKLSEYEEKVASRIVKEISSRFGFLDQVGLNYLTLNRLTQSLSGGEYQRIKLATSLGSALVGSMYVLDEPSIGLHPRDTSKLIRVLEQLRDLGNTVIVVEHEEDVMRAADEILDIGLDAGKNGGTLNFQGTIDEITEDTPSHTARYLKGFEKIPVPTVRRKWNEAITIKGARENNLQNITVQIPLEILTVITGVSGSGKSTLIKKLLYPAYQKLLGNYSDVSGKMDHLDGNLRKITSIEFVDQNPIGKSSRSNPVTYIKAYDIIRNTFAAQPLAKQRGYSASHFSFNVEGGRCETCQGEGNVKIEMQFMADLHLQCESCKGKRFKEETLEILYNEKNISEILDMTVDEAIVFFASDARIIEKLLPLQKVGLGYIGLGQSSNSLSGGEAQRIKLAFFLSKGVKTEPTLFLFDEPTTGLHFHDINKLLIAMNALVDRGHTVIVIEHNLEIIKCADYIIDLGPDGGKGGGYIVAKGTPEEVVLVEESFTGKYLKDKLNH